ncbi:hypothetical protein IscW_ISCW008084 [Ixodes scapularis]|uniref:Uncharacterized protein n=1 Tax=Ixodes scapularis TaxID=6945 RepID=B7PU57_IXOSC|nr:hypothetical protein IscW_ISCW008084 [Ixodes scapularis]|eukprot:XP_002405552.1 hypothetical protein IscW_ISCW008084 [Ixodes scapularis]
MGKSKTRPFDVAVRRRSVGRVPGRQFFRAGSHTVAHCVWRRSARLVYGRACDRPDEPVWRGLQEQHSPGASTKEPPEIPLEPRRRGAGPSPAAANGRAATGSSSPASPGAAVLPIAAATRRERTATTTPPRCSPDEYDADMIPRW